MKVGFPCGLLLIALAAILAYGLPPALGAELPNKAIGQGLPLPEVGGTAQIEVRKKHWRIPICNSKDSFSRLDSRHG